MGASRQDKVSGRKGGSDKKMTRRHLTGVEMRGGRELRRRTKRDGGRGDGTRETNAQVKDAANGGRETDGPTDWTKMK